MATCGLKVHAQWLACKLMCMMPHPADSEAECEMCLLQDVYKQSLDHQQEYTDFAVRMSAESLLNA